MDFCDLQASRETVLMRTRAATVSPNPATNMQGCKKDAEEVFYDYNMLTCRSFEWLIPLLEFVVHAEVLVGGGVSR